MADLSPRHLVEVEDHGTVTVAPYRMGVELLPGVAVSLPRLERDTEGPGTWSLSLWAHEARQLALTLTAAAEIAETRPPVEEANDGQ